MPTAAEQLYTPGAEFLARPQKWLVRAVGNTRCLQARREIRVLGTELMKNGTIMIAQSFKIASASGDILK